MENRLISAETPVEINDAETAPNPFFTAVHGNITYDFFYRSAIDTPYVDNDVIQHLLSTKIYATIRNSVPVIIQLNARRSNSYLFKNYFDANIQFDGQSYRNLTKERLKDRISHALNEQPAIQALQDNLKVKHREKEELRSWLQNGRQLQKLIESRQMITQSFPALNPGHFFSVDQLKQATLDSLEQIIHTSEVIEKYRLLSGAPEKIKQFSNTITAFERTGVLNIQENVDPQKLQQAVQFLKEYVRKNERYAAYQEEISQLEEKYNTVKADSRRKLDSLKQAIDEINDPETLKEQLHQYQLDTIKGYKWMRHLMSVQWLSIGRSNADFSELTVKNISVTGLNVAYVNRLYLAAAAGTIDYRYRDFIVRPRRKVPGHLVLLRAGIGKQEEPGFAFTFYSGKKESLWSGNPNSTGVNNVTGLAFEGRYRIGQHTQIVAEAAKSNYPVFLPTPNNGATNAKLLNLSDRTNEAYSVQVASYIPVTGTRLTGMYKKQGINFQSFNVFNYNSNYSAWAIKADQYFLKRKLFVSGSLKTNEYNSPYTLYHYKSNTLFTSLQMSLRLKKWPVITTAYMPASQLYKNGDEIIETRFSTLMASLSYMYKAGDVYMHSAVIHNRFFNDQDQQQFLYYNASGWMINHSIIGDKLTLHSSANLNYNGNYRLLSLDQGLTYTIKDWLRTGGGIKWNRLDRSPGSWGYSGNMQWTLNKLGEIHLSFDHGFLPGMVGTLLPNDMGRVIYIKTF